ncbi:MAG: ABC transporter substrate-binding protein [Candidatus Rokubacteria bacterium]|nr:ABC transporter substrate-binding protein [Candidatus Rokubacteria bacterium]
MMFGRRGFVAAAALVLLLAPAEAGAGQPTDHLRTQIDRVVRVLEDPELKKESKVTARRGAVRKIANDIFDFSETAKRSLARHWPPRTPAEREEFTALFADLLERSYISKIEVYGGEKIGYLGETIEGDFATVRTRLVTKQQTEIPIDYRMLRRGEKWLVYDVIIEGVSLIANYRTQFNKIITTSSYQELVKKMKTKQEEFYEDERKRTSQR